MDTIGRNIQYNDIFVLTDLFPKQNGGSIFSCCFVVLFSITQVLFIDLICIIVLIITV